MKTMAEGHLAPLTDLPPNSPGLPLIQPNQKQKVRAPSGAAHTDQRVWVGWVMVKEAQGTTSGVYIPFLSALEYSQGRDPPRLPPSQGWAFSSAALPLLLREHAEECGELGLLSWRCPVCRPCMGAEAGGLQLRAPSSSPTVTSPTQGPFWHIP